MIIVGEREAMSNPRDFRREAHRLTDSAKTSTSIGEKRMLETQATFYEVIAAQDDTRLQDEQSTRREEPKEPVQRR